MALVSDKIFREYDIRGIAGSELSSELAVSLGRAYGTFISRGKTNAVNVSVGRDVRLSSHELASGIIEGLISTGINVYDIGICPTPLQYFSVHHLGLDGGIMVTGSHNPPEYNGFKLSTAESTIFGEDIQALKEIIQKEEWKNSALRGGVRGFDIFKAYRKYMLDEFSYLNGPEFIRPKVVVDAGNGTAGMIVPELLRGAGCEVIELYCEPDGTFPNHHPDPTVLEYIEDLINEVKGDRADIGIGYDGDADRIGVVGKTGRIIWGDHLIIILGREILKQNQGAKIIGDVKCSQLMFDDIKRHGGIPIMWKTGHSLVKKKMKEEGALLAGEFSGHIFIADRYFGYDDAIYTTLRLVEIIKRTGRGIEELLCGLPDMHHTPEIRIDCPDEIKHEAVNRVVKTISQYVRNGEAPLILKGISETDGVRVVFEKGWGLIRASNTQPVVVMRVEAEDEESMKSYRVFLEKELSCAMEKR